MTYVVECLRRDEHDGRPLWTRDGGPRCSSSGDKYHTDTVRRVLHLAAAIEDRNERGAP